MTEVTEALDASHEPGIQASRFLSISGILRLDGGDGHCVDDVLDRTTPAQVVDRLFQTLEDRADGNGAGFPLDGLVGVVAGVQVGEDKDRGPARDLGPGHFLLRDTHIDGGVVLHGPVQQEVRPPLAGELGGLAHSLHVFANARLA